MFDLNIILLLLTLNLIELNQTINSVVLRIVKLKNNLEPNLQFDKDLVTY